MRKVAAYFAAHPLEEIDQETIAKIVGWPSLRTRVSDCRKKLGMQIDTIPMRYEGSDGKLHKGLSRYRFVPYVPLARDAGTVVSQKSLPGF